MKKQIDVKTELKLLAGQRPYQCLTRTAVAFVLPLT